MDCVTQFEVFLFVFIGRKYVKYLPSEDFFAKGLYMFDIGQNDIAGAFYSKTLDQILASIPSILTEFETGVKVIFIQKLVSNCALNCFSFLMLLDYFSETI